MSKESKESIKNEIKKTKERLAELERQEKLDGRRDAIKSLNEFTVEEKVEFFDKLYKLAESDLLEAEEQGNIEYIDNTYGFEAYIEILARKKDKFWEYWNSIED